MFNHTIHLRLGGRTLATKGAEKKRAIKKEATRGALPLIIDYVNGVSLISHAALTSNL